MRVSVAVLSVVFVLLLVTGGRAHAQELLVCGWDEVYALELSGTPRKTWSWKASERPELPPAYRTKFRTTDDCKPVGDGRVLITASSDGAALVDRATGRTLWWGACGNAHSAELLPGDRIVLACSTREGTGNKLALFDARTPERELFATPLPSGHGVVWDAARARLWAIGLTVLRAYRLQAWESAAPALELDAEYSLPDESGHELQAVPGTADLVLSTHHGVWRFDRDAAAFRPDPHLAGLADVKSVTIHQTSGRVAYTQAEPPNWWTSHIRFRQHDGDIARPDERLYKVRWVP